MAGDCYGFYLVTGRRILVSGRIGMDLRGFISLIMRSGYPGVVFMADNRMQLSLFTGDE
jgi:hypothetical protein